jgi:hypothetical protein
MSDIQTFVATESDGSQWVSLAAYEAAIHHLSASREEVAQLREEFGKLTELCFDPSKRCSPVQFCGKVTDIVWDIKHVSLSPAPALRKLIREEIKLDKIGMTRLPDTPEERSCETCGGTGELIELYPHGIKERHDCPNCRPSNPKPTPQAPQDALARARRLSECSVKDEVIAYYESAIAEEQARTKLQREIGESRLDENKELRRCLEKAEARYGVAEADRNHEIERREEAERKLADA